MDHMSLQNHACLEERSFRIGKVVINVTEDVEFVLPDFQEFLSGDFCMGGKTKGTLEAVG